MQKFSVLAEVKINNRLYNAECPCFEQNSKIHPFLPKNIFQLPTGKWKKIHCLSRSKVSF
ncbi:MAG: hypothetical protein LBC89_01655 [Bacteroidales bacterium]|nr:hypothetical protein [Bacteroidales bacterium]